jgi:hypothetical protein
VSDDADLPRIYWSFCWTTGFLDWAFTQFVDQDFHGGKHLRRTSFLGQKPDKADSHIGKDRGAPSKRPRAKGKGIFQESIFNLETRLF